MASVYFDDEREVILDAGARLLKARGTNQTTISDIAQSAGFTDLSVAYYYKTTQDLAAACMYRTVEELDAIVVVASAEPHLEARIRRCAKLYFERLGDASVGMRPTLIHFWDMRALVEPAKTVACDAFIALFRRLRCWFADAGCPSLTRPAQNARTLLLLSAFLSAADWITNFDCEDTIRCADWFAEVLIHGFAGPGMTWHSVQPQCAPLSPMPAKSGDFYLRLATEMINEEGYRGASADQIRRQFCIATNSIVPSDGLDSANIVEKCFERSLNMIRDVYRGVPRDSGNGWSRLRTIVAFIVRHQHAGHGPLLRYYALSIVPYKLRPRWTAEMDRLVNLLSGVLTDGIIDESIRPLDTLVTGHMILGFLNAAAELKFWVQGISEDETVTLFARPSLLGVGCSAE